MNAFTKRAGIIGGAGAASAILVVGMVAPAHAAESHRTHDDGDSTSITKVLNDNLNGFLVRDNDRNGILNGDDLIGDTTIGNVTDVVDGGVGNVSDVANGDNGNVSDVANGDIANGDVASGNLNGDNFNGNDVLNGNDTLNGNDVGGVDVGDVASGNETSIEGGDVSVLDDTDVLNDTLDVVDNEVSGTLDDVLNTDDHSSEWGGGDWGKW